jgi:phosphatidylserine decarboxylase
LFCEGRPTHTQPEGRRKDTMASPLATRLIRAQGTPRIPRTTTHYRYRTNPSRSFSSSKVYCDNQHRKESFRSRLNSALKNTKIKWEPIPIALGIGFLGAFQFYRIQRREKHTQAGDENGNGSELDPQGKPKKRERIRPSGPWFVFQWSNYHLTCSFEIGLYRLCLHCH